MKCAGQWPLGWIAAVLAIGGPTASVSGEDAAKEKPIEGKVIAVGNGKLLDNGKLRALDIKAGDVVLFGKYSGTEVKLDGEEHLILREDDVLCVISK